MSSSPSVRRRPGIRRTPGTTSRSPAATSLWSDRESALSLLAFIAGNRAFAADACWYGSIDDPLSTFFEREAIEVVQTSRWMARLVDLERALEARGYPPLDATLAMTVVDPAAGLDRAIRLDVRAGAGTVSSVEAAGARIDIGALTAIFTGWSSARDAVQLGRLSGASEAEVATIDALFGGPRPWMLELF